MADEIRVNLEELQKAENKWTDAGMKLLIASGKAQFNVNLDESKVGIFSGFYATYKLVPAYAFARLSEGIKVCGTVAGTLRAGRGIYEQQEQKNKEGFDGIN